MAFGEVFHGLEQDPEGFPEHQRLVGRRFSREVVLERFGRPCPPDPVDAEVPHEKRPIGPRIGYQVQRIAHLPEFDVQVLYGVQGIGPVLQDVVGDAVETLLQRDPDGMEPGIGHFEACFMRASTWSVRMDPRTLMRASSARMMMSSIRLPSLEVRP